MRLNTINFVSLTAGLALSLGTLGACGSSSPAGTADAAPSTGTHYKYVVDSLSVPASSTESRADGLDLTQWLGAERPRLAAAGQRDDADCEEAWTLHNP